MASLTAPLTDQEQLRCDTNRLLEFVTRNRRFDDAADEPLPIRHRASFDPRYLAMCITIRLAAIMATENAYPAAWDELGRELANLQHSIQANGTAGTMTVRSNERIRQPNEVDEGPTAAQTGRRRTQSAGSRGREFDRAWAFKQGDCPPTRNCARDREDARQEDIFKKLESRARSSCFARSYSGIGRPGCFTIVSSGERVERRLAAV